MATGKPAGAPAQPPAPQAPSAPQTPVSGIQPPRRAIAPQLSEAPKGPDPIRELRQRQDAAMLKHADGSQQAQDAAAREGAPPPPKGKTAAPASSQTLGDAAPAASGSNSSSTSDRVPSKASSTQSGKTSASAAQTPAGGRTADGVADPEATDGAEAAADAAAAGVDSPTRSRAPRYDVQSMRKWAEENPEEAALLREKVFALPADTNQEWIRLKNKQRKGREQLRTEQEAGLAAAKAERDAAEAARAELQAAAEALSPIGDMWAAVAESIRANPDNPQIDFDAGDAAFEENCGIAIDDYMRLRARRRMGGGGPEAARLRVQLAKEKRKNAAPASNEPAKAEAPAEAAPAEPPKGKERKPQHDWSPEIDAKHKLRQIDGWQLKLDDEMNKFRDPDTKDYDEDPEAAADRVLKRELESFMAELQEDEPPAAPARRAPPKVPPKAPKKMQSASIPGVPSARELTPKGAPPRNDPRMDPEHDDNHPVMQSFAKRQQWAIDRALRAARGEQVEGYE